MRDGVWELPGITIHRRLAALDIGERLGWHITDFGYDVQTWPKSTGEQVTIGIVDSGVDYIHSDEIRGDLFGRVVSAKDFTGSRHGPRDVLGHGTHVAGIASAVRGNNRGIVGLAHGASLKIAKGLGDTGQGTDRSVGLAIEWLLNEGVDVINLSLGSDHPLGTYVHDAIKSADAAGVPVVCAAGNSASDVNYPARWPESIAVVSIGRDGRLSSFSCRGEGVDFAAPGEHIRSTYLGGEYSDMSGTSMSSPSVAAIIAIVMSYKMRQSAKPKWTARQWREYLGAVSDTGGDELLGGGVVRSDRLLADVAPPDEERRQLASLFGGRVRIMSPAASTDQIGVAIG